LPPPAPSSAATTLERHLRAYAFTALDIMIP
jgi:hypothetical protein